MPTPYHYLPVVRKLFISKAPLSLAAMGLDHKRHMRGWEGLCFEVYLGDTISLVNLVCWELLIQA